MSKYYIGTSGFSYPSWKGNFYPQDLTPAQWLAYYSTQFNSLELNNTFYKFPTAKALIKMAESTPDDFMFSVKANQKITHIMLVKNAKETINDFTAITEDGLGEKLGNILFQFPPSFRYSDENLDNILNNLTHQSRNVIEFRHASWWTQEVLDTLRRHHLTFCSVSFPKLSEDLLFSTEKLYLRMHGVPELFKSPYSEEQLMHITRSLPDAPEKVFVYFNNTTYDAGYSNARTLEKFIKNHKMNASNIHQS